MGTCTSNTSSSVDKTLNSELTQNRLRDRSTKKLLLLGTGNCGKSTIFKQLLQIHGEGLTNYHSQKQKEDIIKSIRQCILSQIRYIIFWLKEMKYPLNNQLSEIIEYFDKFRTYGALNNDIAQKIKKLWQNKSVKKVYQNRSNVQIADSIVYFLDEIERFGKDNFEPTERDLILIRIPTTGVVSNTFEVEKHSFEVYDVGGERSERTKWISCFDSVTTVIYVCSLSCYDQTLFEDDKVNCMHETINLFDEICNSRWFKQQLVKRDRRGNGNFVYTHVITATNKASVQQMFSQVTQLSISQSLYRGLLL